MEDSQAVSMVCLYTYECLAFSPCSKLILEKAVGIRAILVWFTVVNCVGESTIRHFRYCYTNVTPYYARNHLLTPWSCSLNVGF